MHSRWMSRLAIVVTLAIAPELALASSPTLTERYSYEPNVANRSLGCAATIAAGDLNGDGFADVAASANGGAYAFYGKSGGPFVSSPWVGTGYGSTPAAVGDVNGDGYDDLVTFDPSTPSAAGHVYLFAGSSSGLGSTPVATIVGPADSSGWGVATGVGDVNRDGYTDIVVAAPAYLENGQPFGRLLLYLGASSGFFPNPVPFSDVLTRDLGIAHVGAIVFAAGDADGDGYADIGVVADREDSLKFVMVFMGSSTGPASTPAWSDSGTFTRVTGPADFNGDGYSDFLAVRRQGASLYLGKTTGMSRISMASEGSCWLLGDANGDGRSDVLSQEGGYYCDCFLPQCHVRCGNVPGDQHLYLGKPSGMFHEADLGSFSFQGSEAGDVDGDGFDDILSGFCGYSNGQSNEGRVVISSFAAPKPKVLTEKPSFIPGLPGSWALTGAGDIDEDGCEDFALGEPGYVAGEVPEGRVSVFRGSSTDGGAVSPTFSLVGSSPGSSFGASLVGQGDVNGDGYPDLVVGAPHRANGEPEEGWAFLYRGGATPDPLPDWSVESNLPYANLGSAVAWAGDVNGDGYGDVLIAAPGSPQFAQQDGLPANDAHAQLYLGSPAGLAPLPGWTASGSSFSGFASAVAGTGDVNGDGFSDVAIGVPGSNQVLLYHGSSAGLPAAPSATLQGTGGFGSVIAAAGDVNGDGYADLLVGSPLQGDFSPAGRAQLFLGTPSGLAPVPAWTVDGAAGDALGSALAGGDLDDDGFSDVVVGSPGHASDMGEVRVYLGSAGGPSFETSIPGEGPGSRLGANVACADLNGDGFTDALLGQPANGYLGSGNGSVRLLQGGGELGRSYRVRQRSPNGSVPVALMGSSGSTGFGIRALAFGAAGRSRVRLEWQVRTPGASWSAPQHGPWLDSGAPQSTIGSARELDATVSGLAASTPYAWRARVASSGPDVYRSGRWLSMPGSGRSLAAMRTGTAILGAPEGQPATAGRLLSAVRPNPTASLVRVRLELPGTEPAVIDVFDVGGRQVRRIESTSGGATARELTWDLRDDRGRPAGAGLYFLRASARRGSDVERVVVLP